MKIEISKQAFGVLINAQHPSVDHTLATEEGTGWIRTTSTVHDMLLITVTNYQGSQPITQYYLTDINA